MSGHQRLPNLKLSIQVSPLSAVAVPTVNDLATVRAVTADRPVTYTAPQKDSGENFTLCLSVVVLVGLSVIGAINGFNNNGNSKDNDSSGSYRRSWTSSSSSSSSGSRSSGSNGSSSSRGGGGGGFG